MKQANLLTRVNEANMSSFEIGDIVSNIEGLLLGSVKCINPTVATIKAIHLTKESYPKGFFHPSKIVRICNLINLTELASHDKKMMKWLDQNSKRRVGSGIELIKSWQNSDRDENQKAITEDLWKKFPELYP